MAITHRSFPVALPIRLTRLAAPLLAGALAALASSAAAQTYGPATPGVCVFSRDQALSASQAGVSASQQIAQFTQGARAELGAQRTAIYNDDRALAAQKTQLAAADYQQRIAQLRQRYQSLDRTTQTRDAQLTQTRKDAFAQVAAVMSPSLAEIITTRRCGVVLEKATTYGSNPDMDITALVIQRMNARLPLLNLRQAPPETVQRAR
jgi:outer membrane protein